jgi:hypothetical protein
MILYTLLTTHKDKDLTNVILTSTLVYYMIYSALPIERNYIIIAAVIMCDLYFTSNVSKSNGKSGNKSPSKSKHKARARTQTQAGGQRRVRFAPTHDTRYYQPNSIPDPRAMAVPGRMLPQVQPTRSYPQTTNPMFNQYITQQQQARMGQNHQPLQLNSSYHRADNSQYYRAPRAPQPTVMIDNRHLAPEDESASSGSEESIYSDTISYSSEEY